MEEQWKDIIIEKNGVTYDYSELYQVSNFGRVRSLDRVDSRGHKLKGKIIRCKPRENGYVYVGLHKNGEKQQLFTMHRLVATMFIPNPENLPIVNHKDEDKYNNNVDNLEWCTQEYNNTYGTCRKRAGEKISEKMKGDKNPMSRKVICLETKQVFNTVKDAEDWLGKKGIGNCCRGITKTAGGHHWQFLDDYKRQLRKQSDIKNSQLVA